VALPPVPLPIDEPITSPRVLVCEGAGDKNFFEQLIKERQLPDFYITYPREEFEGGGGKSKFAVRLRSLRLQHGFDLVKGIIVAGDNDRDQQSSFANVRKLILDSGYKPPNKPLQTVRGDPAVCIADYLSVCGGLRELLRHQRQLEPWENRTSDAAGSYGSHLQEGPEHESLSSLARWPRDRDPTRPSMLHTASRLHGRIRWCDC